MSERDGAFAEMVTFTPLNTPYWDALDEGRLVFQRCAACASAWLPPREACPSCLSDKWEWETASGRGRLISWVVYHVVPDKSFAARAPYNVAIIELDEGPRLITNLVDDDDKRAKIDAAVRLDVRRDGGLSLARFRLEAEDESP